VTAACHEHGAVSGSIHFDLCTAALFCAILGSPTAQDRKVKAKPYPPSQTHPIQCLRVRMWVFFHRGFLFFIAKKHMEIGLLSGLALDALSQHGQKRGGNNVR
jgi:hypothetical protein